MALTRFKYDKSRIIKELQQSTDPGRWIINVPGNGTKPDYIEDPNIRIQKWGANLMTNHTDIESTLRGITINNNKDYLDQTKYKKNVKTGDKIYYPRNEDLYVEQLRMSEPAWELRTKENNNWLEPLYKKEPVQMIPNEKHQINTRNLEREYYERQGR